MEVDEAVDFLASIGLHIADVERLICVLHRFVEGGHSVVQIENDFDVVAEADWHRARS